MPPAFNDSTSAPGPSPRWKSSMMLVARAARQAAVVALDGDAGAFVRCSASRTPHSAKCVNTEHPLAGREHRIDDLLEPGELSRTTGERPVVVLVRGRVVADLFERGDRREDLALARFGALGSRVAVTSVSSTAWYMPICSGVIAQWSSSSIWSGSSAAISGSAFVRRNTRMPLSARIASSASTRVALPSFDEPRDELRAACRRGPGS